MSPPEQIAHDAAGAAPKLLVAGGLAAFTDDLDLLIKVLGALYIVLQIAFLAYRWHILRKSNKDEQ